MGIIDLFSKRQKRARGEMPDVYAYNNLPRSLRVQIIHIVNDAFGTDKYNSFEVANAYEFINNTLCREYGLFKLVENQNSHQESIFNFFLQEETTERALDFVELCFKVINVIANNKEYRHNTTRKIEPDEAISELNDRFKENRVGYQFESNELIRIDSDFLHAEAVKPTLTVLRGSGFKGANEEFLLAHDHYRHGRYKESLVESLKAFESTMKAICTIRRWTVQPGNNAKGLIAICLNNGLLPSYFDAQFTSLRSLLESGVPTVRNKNGGHGQGPEPVIVPEYLARYALNITASTVLFLVEAHEAKK